MDNADTGDEALRDAEPASGAPQFDFAEYWRWGYVVPPTGPFGFVTGLPGL